MAPTPAHAPPGPGHPAGPPGSGFCGLTAREWHWALAFVILLIFVFFIAVVVAWVRSEDVSEIWLKAKHHAQLARAAWHEELLKHALPQHDRLITHGPDIGARPQPTVNIILASLFPSMRPRPGPS